LDSIVPFRARSPLDAAETLGKATDLGDLWRRFHAVMGEFGITGCLYGFTAPLISLDEIEAGGFKRGTTTLFNSLDPEWLETKCANDLFDCDEYVVAAFSEVQPILWSDAVRLEYLTDGARRSLEVDYDFGVLVGVTVPMRFANGLGGSSIGLHSTTIGFAEFDRVWAENAGAVTTIVGCLDQLVRGEHVRETFPLTECEREILTRLALGWSAQRVSEHMGLSDRGRERALASAKQKLGARTTAHALARALILELIAP